MISYARDHSVADGLNYVATWNAAMLMSADLQAAMMAGMSKSTGLQGLILQQGRGHRGHGLDAGAQARLGHWLEAAGVRAGDGFAASLGCCQFGGSAMPRPNITVRIWRPGRPDRPKSSLFITASSSNPGGAEGAGERRFFRVQCRIVVHGRQRSFSTTVTIGMRSSGMPADMATPRAMRFTPSTII
jgi:hypothetical protein